jgi:hypothetical protein
MTWIYTAILRANMGRWQVHDHIMKRAYHSRQIATTLNTAKIYARSHTRVPTGYAVYSNPELSMTEEEHNPKKNNKRMHLSMENQCPKCNTHRESAARKTSGTTRLLASCGNNHCYATEDR